MSECWRNPKRKRKVMHDLSDFASIGIVAKGPLDQYLFNRFITDFVQERSADIYRTKGVLHIKGKESRKFLFQGVHSTVKYGFTDEQWSAEEQPHSSIVFIGRNLDRRAIAEAFQSTGWQPLPPGWKEYMCKTTQQPYYVNSEQGIK